jgi:cyclase
MRNRTILISSFAVMLCLAFFRTEGEAQPNTIKQIVPGVWFREGDINNLGHCNNAVIEMKDYLIIVDANFPSGARAALADAKRVSPKPIKYVFDTHHHGDHAYGNAVWTKMGAVTLAYVGVAEEMKRYEPKRWLGTAQSRPDVAEMKLSQPEPPKETFSKSPHIIKDDTREVQFYFLGWAHTRGDGFVYLPKEKVLCTGDAVVNGPYNYTGDGNVTNWPKVVAAAQKFDVAYVLPGHGPSGGKELLTNQARFMVELRAAVNREVKAGKKLEDLVTMKENQPTATSIRLPESVKAYVGDGLAGQVRDTYLEITTGKASGDQPH